MKTNELKKGDVVMLSSGWPAVMYDNRRGNTRMAKVFGDYTEIGSIYAHDIVCKVDATEEKIVAGAKGFFRAEAYIEHTPAQIKLRKLANNF